jgi:hypothetical protein
VHRLYRRRFHGAGHQRHRIGHGVILRVDDGEPLAQVVDVDAVASFMSAMAGRAPTRYE